MKSNSSLYSNYSTQLNRPEREVLTDNWRDMMKRLMSKTPHHKLIICKPRKVYSMPKLKSVNPSTDSSTSDQSVIIPRTPCGTSNHSMIMPIPRI